MFDFGAINKSAEAMAQAATDIVSRLESIENLTREQNALLGALVIMAALPVDEQGRDIKRSQAYDLAQTAFERIFR